MASVKGKDDALTPSASPKDASELGLTPTTVLISQKNVVGSGSMDQPENGEEEFNAKGKAIVAVNNEDDQKAEDNDEEYDIAAEEENDTAAAAEEEEEEENDMEEEEEENDMAEEEEENDMAEEEEENDMAEGEEENDMAEGEEENDMAEGDMKEGNAMEEDMVCGKGGEEKAEEEHKGGKSEENLKGKGREPRQRIRKKNAAEGSEKRTKDKPELSSKKKASKRVDSMGMVFICSSKTKNDCFRYKVLGLPSNKKDQVEKIYKGMRLFLFDIDLRLMYGIYKAAGPGGYNLEPKAFKSAFPSQVKFTVLEDCLPLAEEKFKKVIKENYYSQNKFNCQLDAEQVKKLCKLFIIPGKVSGSKRAGRSHRNIIEDAHTSIDRDRSMRKVRNEERRFASHRERRAQVEERRPAYVSERRLRDPPVVYEREVLSSPVAPMKRYIALPPEAPVLAPARSYLYERSLDPYAREPVLERHHGLHLIESEPRHHDEIRNHNAYILYREPPPLYGDTIGYSIGQTSEYQPSASALPSEYCIVGREYHTSAGRAVEYPSSLDRSIEYHSSLSRPVDYHLPAGSRPNYRSVESTGQYLSSGASLPDSHPRRMHYRY